MTNEELEKELKDKDSQLNNWYKEWQKQEKRIEELEKENTELKHQLAHRNCVDCSNHSSNLRMRNLDLEKENAELKEENKVLAQNLEDTEILNKTYEKRFDDLEKENTELKSIAEFQQSSNMSRHFENKKLKEGLAVGSTFNKALNSMNKNLEEERDKYRNMVFDKDEQLTNAKEIIRKFMKYEINEYDGSLEIHFEELKKQAERFLKGE